MKKLEERKPIISPGAVIQLSGHPAEVVKIVRDGVCVKMKNKEFVISFDQIEIAIKQHSC